MTDVDVSVVLVTYRSAGWLDGAIGSARASATHAGLMLEVIVVDNASDDGSADLAATVDPTARVIRNATNVGFGAATNQAMAIARGRTLLLLNPDARLEPDALAVLIGFLDMHPRAAIAAPTIDGPGSAESAGMLPSLRSAVGHFLFGNRILPPGRGGAWRGFQVSKRPGEQPVRIEWASAAVLAARPAAMREVGGFDESIFLYGEDLDLAARLGRAGWQVWLVPAARAWHGIGASSAGISTRWVDGLDDYLVRRGAHRLRRASFHLIVAGGLAVRATAGGGADEAARTHARRMRAGATRALRLAVSAIAGRRDSPD